MYYFEFMLPYYALIKAKNGEGAVEKYIEVVAGDETEFDDLLEECKMVPEYYAGAKFSRSVGEDGKMLEMEEVINVLKSEKTELLLMDGSLI